MAKKKYTVSGGKLILTLEPADGGWFAVTTPMDPAVQTQAKTIPEAFEIVRDAMKVLQQGRAKLAKDQKRRSA